jgi:hypothetical protein
MMTVALFYNPVDLNGLLATLQATAPTLSGTQRTACNRIITAIGDPALLPLAPAQYQDDIGNVLLIVLNYSGASRQEFRDAIIQWFDANPGARGWLRAIWKDCRTTAVDPWTG